jgi:hypothetical protein
MARYVWGIWTLETALKMISDEGKYELGGLEAKGYARRAEDGSVCLGELAGESRGVT